MKVPPASGMSPILAKACNSPSGRADDVAGQRQIGPGTRRHPIDGGDGRHRQRPQAPDDGVVGLLDDGGDVEIRFDPEGRVGKVLPGGECPARAGDQQHRAARPSDLVEKSDQTVEHRPVERVDLFRPIERYDRHRPVTAELDIFLHGEPYGAKSPRCRCGRCRSGRGRARHRLPHRCCGHQALLLAAPERRQPDPRTVALMQPAIQLLAAIGICPRAGQRPQRSWSS